jgi:hypothetical protein
MEGGRVCHRGRLHAAAVVVLLIEDKSDVRAPRGAKGSINSAQCVVVLMLLDDVAGCCTRSGLRMDQEIAGIARSIAEAQ